MSCGSSGSGRFTKKRIIVFASLGAGIATASYFAFTMIDSRALVASSALLGLAACPLMCAAMGGAMWIKKRISKSKNKSEKSNNNNQNSCCSDHSTKEVHETEQVKNVEVSKVKRKKKKNKELSQEYN